MPDTETVGFQKQFEGFLQTARRIASDLGREVEKMLQEGRDNPLPREKARALLTKVVEALKKGAHRRGDGVMVKKLEGDIRAVVEELVDIGPPRPADLPASAPPDEEPAAKIDLVEHRGIKPMPIFPRPCFHQREVALKGGYVKVTDINLWAENERLEIHLGHFQQQHGRHPEPDELLAIMFSKMPLPGLDKEDQFQIVELARSIANNGVRKPPIIDIFGNLLDGNRRIAACYYILGSKEFSTEQKYRAQYVYVWQLPELATQEERDAVIVSLNFESDCKVAWPVYIRCRRVYEEWLAVLNLELERPNAQRQAVLKRQISEKFALGPDTATVSRYIKMAEGAIDFEDYHITERKLPEFEVKHRANEYIEWFDELAKGKGAKSEGVAYVLEQNPVFKHLVYELMYDGKFQNFRQIRELKRIFENQEASELLERARKEPNQEVAEEHLKNAMSIARTQEVEQRQLGANTRIEGFVTFLEGLPSKAFRDLVSAKNLQRLLDALKLVEPIVSTVLKERASAPDAATPTPTGGAA
jgi:hypothetical protein